MGHTKGQLEVVGTPDLSLFIVQKGKHDIILGSGGGDNDLADFARFVTCWNALEGIDDPAAFMRDVQAWFMGGNTTIRDDRECFERIMIALDED